MLWSLFLSFLVVSLVVAVSLTQPAALGWLLLFVAGVIMLYYYFLGFYWGSLALFVVFVGGLLVAFSFISATASNWTLVEYYSTLWWSNVFLSVFSLVIIFGSIAGWAYSSSSLILSISSVVGSQLVVVFWVCVVALLLVLVAGVKMCVGFSGPLHWLN